MRGSLICQKCPFRYDARFQRLSSRAAFFAMMQPRSVEVLSRDTIRKILMSEELKGHCCSHRIGKPTSQDLLVDRNSRFHFEGEL
jgi:hypothetical protein